MIKITMIKIIIKNNNIKIFFFFFTIKNEGIN
jgi:hypothetical protein